MSAVSGVSNSSSWVMPTVLVGTVLLGVAVMAIRRSNQPGGAPEVEMGPLAARDVVPVALPLAAAPAAVAPLAPAEKAPIISSTWKARLLIIGVLLGIGVLLYALKLWIALGIFALVILGILWLMTASKGTTYVPVIVR